tara:strand:- start:869 stop:1219 length:351 start_codon:yes stop_codon:yes gene_type:complete
MSKYNGKVFLTDAAISLRPNGGVSLLGTDAKDLLWDAVTLASSEGAPTVAEVKAEQKRLQAIEDATAYQRTRASAYPEIAEQLDLLYHDMVAGKGDKTGTWFSTIKKVKDDNAKPS